MDKRIENIKEKRIGEVFRTTSGVDVEIVEYFGSTNITIKWLDDGSIQTGCRYVHLKSGKVRKTIPNRVGETVKQNCGMNATIIDYISSHNITIKFEDGVTLTKKYYRDFKLGLVKHPNIKIFSYSLSSLTPEELIEKQGAYVRYRKNKEKYLGSIIVNKNKQVMKIIKYRASHDIDVQFEDGTIVKHQRLEHFKQRKIVNPNNKIVSHTSLNEFTMLFYFKKIGFLHYECCQLKDIGLGRYSLDAYNKNLKIAIEYDGGIHSFRPNTDIKKDLKCKELGIHLIRIREKMEVSSENAFCYKLNKQSHFSTEYEDILKQISSYLHTKFNLPLLNIDFNRDKEMIMQLFEKEYINSYVGQEYISNKGEHIVIVRYIGANEVFIKFDDGFIKKVSMKNIKNGSFSRFSTIEYNKKERIGKTKTMKNGMKCTCIDYRSCNDCDFQFEDGTIVTNKRYDTFTSKSLGNPMYTNKKKIS